MAIEIEPQIARLNHSGRRLRALPRPAAARLDDLQPGLYWLRISAGGAAVTRRVVKR